MFLETNDQFELIQSSSVQELQNGIILVKIVPTSSCVCEHFPLTQCDGYGTMHFYHEDEDEQECSVKLKGSVKDINFNYTRYSNYTGTYEYLFVPNTFLGITNENI